MKYLVEEAGIDPATTAQVGRRAYHGRTATHWAARNGHTDVVAYLVGERGAPVDARTAEGTTAFAWACWQGHVSTARWLAERGNCAFGAVNTFGCNAAMWCVQGRAAGLDACEYVKSLGVSFRLLNANGHSAAHKAAQRGRRDVCAWLLGWEWPEGRDAPAPARLKSRDANPRPIRSRGWSSDAAHLGPDDEGFRPSDLARLAGDVRLRDFLEARQREWDAETDETDETNERDERDREGRNRARSPSAPPYDTRTRPRRSSRRRRAVTFVCCARAWRRTCTTRARITALARRYTSRRRAGGGRRRRRCSPARWARAFASTKRVAREGSNSRRYTSPRRCFVDETRRRRRARIWKPPRRMLKPPTRPRRTRRSTRRTPSTPKRVADAPRRVRRLRKRRERTRTVASRTLEGDSRARARAGRRRRERTASCSNTARIRTPSREYRARAVADGDEGVATRADGSSALADGSSALVDARPRDLAGRAAAAEIAALEAETAESPPARAPRARVGDWSFPSLETRRRTRDIFEEFVDAPRRSPSPVHR